MDTQEEEEEDDRKQSAREEEETSSSDVEMEGIDMNADEDEEESAADDDEEEDTGTVAGTSNEEDNAVIAALENADHVEIEEAQKERLELMAAEGKEGKEGMKPMNAQARFEYLMAQSDVFAHFLAGRLQKDTTRYSASSFVVSTASHLCSLSLQDPLLQEPKKERRVLEAKQIA